MRFTNYPNEVQNKRTKKPMTIIAVSCHVFFDTEHSWVFASHGIDIVEKYKPVLLQNILSLRLSDVSSHVKLYNSGPEYHRWGPEFSVHRTHCQLVSPLAISSGHLVKVVPAIHRRSSARFLHCQVTISPYVIHNYLRGRSSRLC